MPSAPPQPPPVVLPANKDELRAKLGLVQTRGNFQRCDVVVQAFAMAAHEGGGGDGRRASSAFGGGAPAPTERSLALAEVRA